MTEQGHSKEFELLLQCCRAYLGTGTVEALPHAQWDEFSFLSMTKTHRISNVVALQVDGLPLSANTKNHIKTLSRNNKQRSMSQCKALLRVKEVLDAAEIDFITMKGILLSQKIYGDLTFRSSRDIDVLVRPQDLLNTYHTLLKAGFVQLSPALELTQQNVSTYSRLTNQISFSFGQEQKMELHWALFKERDSFPHSMSEVWQRSETLHFMGRDFRVLDHDLLFEYLFLHGARHHYYNLFWLMDVAQMVRHMDAQVLQQQMDFAKSNDLERPLALSLALTEELFKIETHVDYRKSAPFPKQFSYAMRILKRSGSLPATLVNHWKLLSYRTSLKKSWTYRIDHFKLYSIKDFGTLPLPTYLRWTFLFLRPFLLASRYLSNSKR